MSCRNAFWILFQCKNCFLLRILRVWSWAESGPLLNPRTFRLASSVDLKIYRTSNPHPTRNRSFLDRRLNDLELDFIYVGNKIVMKGLRIVKVLSCVKGTVLPVTWRGGPMVITLYFWVRYKRGWRICLTWIYYRARSRLPVRAIPRRFLRQPLGICYHAVQ